jgi:hypothetical protein
MERLADRDASHCVWSVPIYGYPSEVGGCRLAVNNISQRIEGTPQQAVTCADRRLKALRNDLRVGGESIQSAEWREERHATLDSNHLGHQKLAAAGIPELADVADTRIHARRANQSATRLCHAANPLQRFDAAQSREEPIRLAAS